MADEKDPNTALTLPSTRSLTIPEADFSGGFWSDLMTVLGAGSQGPVKSPKVILTPTEQKAVDEKAQYVGLNPSEEKELRDAKIADQKAYEIANDIGGRVYGWRTIKGIRPDVQDSYYDSLGVMQYGTTTDPGTKLRPNNPDTYRNLGIPGGAKQAIQYKGSALTDENNYLVRRKYNLDDETDARNELFTMSPDAMLDVLTEIHRVGGFYTGTETVSNVAKNRKGYDANDLQAFTKYLDYSNERQKTWQTLLPEVATYTSMNKTSGGAVARVDTTEDIIAVVNEAMLSMTGEKLNKSQWVKIAAQVKADQRQAFYSNESPTDLRVAARDIASKTNPSKGASYGLGKAMSLAFSALGSQ